MPQVPLVIPGAVKIEMIGTVGTRACVNVMGGEWLGATPTVAVLNTAAAAVLSSWKTRFLPLCSDAYTVSQCRITSLDSATAPQGASSSPGNGTKANGAAPQVSQIIKLLTAIRSRSTRGRLYLPPPGEADVNSTGILLGQQVTDLGTAMSGHISAMSAAGMNLSVLSRKLMVSTNISGFQVQSTVATQKRRLRG